MTRPANAIAVVAGVIGLLAPTSAGAEVVYQTPKGGFLLSLAADGTRLAFGSYGPDRDERIVSFDSVSRRVVDTKTPVPSELALAGRRSAWIVLYNNSDESGDDFYSYLADQAAPGAPAREVLSRESADPDQIVGLVRLGAGFAVTVDGRVQTLGGRQFPAGAATAGGDGRGSVVVGIADRHVVRSTLRRIVWSTAMRHPVLARLRPDGSVVVFSYIRAHRGELAVIDPAGHVRRRVATPGTPYREDTMSVSGTRVLWHSDHRALVTSLRTGRSRVIAAADGPSREIAGVAIVGRSAYVLANSDRGRLLRFTL